MRKEHKSENLYHWYGKPLQLTMKRIFTTGLIVLGVVIGAFLLLLAL